MAMIKALCFFYYLLILPFIWLGRKVWWGVFKDTVEKKKKAERAVLKAARKKGPQELEKLGVISLQNELLAAQKQHEKMEAERNKVLKQKEEDLKKEEEKQKMKTLQDGDIWGENLSTSSESPTSQRIDVSAASKKHKKHKEYDLSGIITTQDGRDIYAKKIMQENTGLTTPSRKHQIKREEDDLPTAQSGRGIHGMESDRATLKNTGIVEMDTPKKQKKYSLFSAIKKRKKKHERDDLTTTQSGKNVYGNESGRLEHTAIAIDGDSPPEYTDKSKKKKKKTKKGKMTTPVQSDYYYEDYEETAIPLQLEGQDNTTSHQYGEDYKQTNISDRSSIITVKNKFEENEPTKPKKKKEKKDTAKDKEKTKDKKSKSRASTKK